MTSKPLFRADSLRRALRIVHCLQRERGPSCAPTENHDFLVQSRLDTDHALKESQSIRLGEAPIQLVLEKIRGMIDEHCVSSHRTLVCFTTLISAVLHEHILRYISKAIAAMPQPQSTVEKLKKDNGFSRIKSHQNFMSLGSTGVLSDSQCTRRQRSQSIGLSTEITSETHSGISDALHADEALRKEELTDQAAGVPIDASPQDDTTLSRLASLSRLLAVFVCIKESTGKERASLYSMLASGQAAADANFMLGDVVMEVENQRRQLEQLQEIRNHPLQNVVQELVIMSKDMQHIQGLLASGCMLDSIKKHYSARQLWDLLTVYMDKLHSLELLIVEEMELALPMDNHATTMHSEILGSAILSDAFGTISLKQLQQSVDTMSSEEVKRRLLCAIKTQLQSDSVIEEKSDEEAASTGVDELMKRLNGNLPAMKEWEIDVYELKFLKRIGQGAAGTTYLADWSGENVAVKVASITNLGLEGWRTEVQALQKLHHPNIIRLLGSVYHQQPLTFCLVLEYCNAGDLATAMTKTTPPNFFFHVSTSITKGLVYLHNRGVIHRDIKPHNVLLHGDLASGQYQVKVTDFGVAADLNNLEDRSPETGTYRFMAPEVIRHEPYTETADVYSFGIIMWQLLTHEEPFAHLGQIEAAAVVAMEFARPVFPNETPPPVKDLIERCWAEDFAERPSFSEILLELNATKFDLSERAKIWLEAPLGHPVYKKATMPPVRFEVEKPSEDVVNEIVKQDMKKKKKFGLFSRKSSYF